MEDSRKKEITKLWWQPAIEVFYQVTGLIAGPIIIALFLGRYLDEKYQSGQKFFFGLLALAFIISITGIMTLTKRYAKKTAEEVKNKLLAKNNKEDNKQDQN